MNKFLSPILLAIYGYLLSLLMLILGALVFTNSNLESGIVSFLGLVGFIAWFPILVGTMFYVILKIFQRPGHWAFPMTFVFFLFGFLILIIIHIIVK